MAEDMIKVTLEPDPPKDFTPTLSDLKSKATNLSRMSEKGLINEVSGATVVTRENGQINIASGKYAQYKLNPNGRAVEHSIVSDTITNRKKYTVDEFVINDHKLNPHLYELTDMKKISLQSNAEALVGNFCITGTVLVKAWEVNLKRYVLIRRPVRIPMFSPLLNAPAINTAIGVDDPLKINEDILAKSDKGYQVNALISDAKSLVGKPGVDRGASANGDASKNNNGAAGKGDQPVDKGLELGSQSWMGVTMNNGTNGCVEAATKIGSYYSKFLCKELENGVVGVSALVSDAEAAGVQVIDFNAGSLAKGDVIVYGSLDHVVLADGAGGYVGNSSSQNQVVKGSDYNSIGLTPTKIIKTSAA